MPKYSLVIPCFNEEKNLPHLISNCEIFENKDNWEIILVDNGSTDNSTHVLNELLKNKKNITSIKLNKNIGYGDGITKGLQKASGDFIGWCHADLQTDPKDALQVEKIFSAQYNSYAKGKRYGRPLFDIFFTFCMSIFETILLKKVLFDINAQPNFFPKSFFNELNDMPADFSLDLFIYYHAKKKGLKVVRFPVKFGDRLYGKSHWNLDFSSKLKFIKRTVSYSLELNRKVNCDNNKTPN